MLDPRIGQNEGFKNSASREPGSTETYVLQETVPDALKFIGGGEKEYSYVEDMEALRTNVDSIKETGCTPFLTYVPAREALYSDSDDLFHFGLTQANVAEASIRTMTTCFLINPGAFENVYVNDILSIVHRVATSLERTSYDKIGEKMAANIVNGLPRGSVVRVLCSLYFEPEGEIPDLESDTVIYLERYLQKLLVPRYKEPIHKYNQIEKLLDRIKLVPRVEHREVVFREFEQRADHLPANASLEISGSMEINRSHPSCLELVDLADKKEYDVFRESGRKAGFYLGAYSDDLDSYFSQLDMGSRGFRRKKDTDRNEIITRMSGSIKNLCTGLLAQETVELSEEQGCIYNGVANGIEGRLIRLLPILAETEEWFRESFIKNTLPPGSLISEVYGIYLLGDISIEKYDTNQIGDMVTLLKTVRNAYGLQLSRLCSVDLDNAIALLEQRTLQSGRLDNAHQESDNFINTLPRMLRLVDSKDGFEYKKTLKGYESPTDQIDEALPVWKSQIGQKLTELEGIIIPGKYKRWNRVKALREIGMVKAEVNDAARKLCLCAAFYPDRANEIETIFVEMLPRLGFLPEEKAGGLITGILPPGSMIEEAYLNYLSTETDIRGYDLRHLNDIIAIFARVRDLESPQTDINHINMTYAVNRLLLIGENQSGKEVLRGRDRSIIDFKLRYLQPALGNGDGPDLRNLPLLTEEKAEVNTNLYNRVRNNLKRIVNGEIETEFNSLFDLVRDMIAYVTENPDHAPDFEDTLIELVPQIAQLKGVDIQILSGLPTFTVIARLYEYCFLDKISINNLRPDAVPVLLEAMNKVLALENLSTNMRERIVSYKEGIESTVKDLGQ